MNQPSNNSSENHSKAFNLALRYLNLRIRSIKELRDYLVKKKFSEDVIQDVIQQLIELKFLNDKTFGESLIRNRQRKGKSAYLISYELKQKGLDDNTISELKENSQGDLQTAKDFISRKKHLYENLSKIDYRNKVGRLLQSKGFSWDVIREVLKED